MSIQVYDSSNDDKDRLVHTPVCSVACIGATVFLGPTSLDCQTSHRTAEFTGTKILFAVGSR